MKEFIKFPSDSEIKKIQSHEKAPFWSKCVESFLRKHGLVAIDTAYKEKFCIITRGSKQKSHSTAIIECDSQPMNHSSFEEITQKSEIINLYDGNNNYIGSFGYPKIRLRHIPPRGTAYKEPYDFISNESFHRHAPIKWKSFQGNNLKVHAYASTPENENLVPCIIENSEKIFFGIPFFDLIGAAASFPPLDEGYYDTLIPAVSFVVESFVFKIIENYLRTQKIPYVKSKLWPDSFQSCFTIRHDYDRPISLTKIFLIFLFYKINKIKTSFGFLSSNIPKFHPSIVRFFKQEINLHSAAHDYKSFCNEFNFVEKTTESSICGITSHGGQGAKGWLGDNQYEWIEKKALYYGEILGRQSGLPQPVNRIGKNCTPETSKIWVPASHISIDAGMKKEQHYLDDLLVSIPISLKRGEQVVLMSHPDIHMREVFALIKSLNKKTVWKATILEVLKWTKGTRYDVTISFSSKKLEITHQTSIPYKKTYYYINGKKSCPIHFKEKQSNAFLDLA